MQIADVTVRTEFKSELASDGFHVSYIKHKYYSIKVLCNFA
jgi:hypothetical protein